MLYLYDRAISDDLRRSFDPDNMGTSVVKVVDPDIAVDVVSQIENDEFKFPAVVITRESPYSLDMNRWNFTRLHRGVPTVIDHETNEIYFEKVLPISLSYNMTILTTNRADMDELTREILFKYSDMYYLKINLPYEDNRSMRFGIALDTDADIEESSKTLEYLQGGKAYQNIISLRTEGCVLLSYTPRKLMRFDTELEVDTRTRNYQ